MAPINRFVSKTVNIFFIIFMSLVFCIGIYTSIKVSPLATIAFLVIMAIAFFCFYVKKLSLPAIPYNKVFYIMLLICFVLLLVFGFFLRNNPTWDCGKLIRTAYEQVVTGGFKDHIYFARYPNNQLWLVCLIAVFSCFRFFVPNATEYDCFSVSIVLSCVLIVATVFLIHAIAMNIWKDEKRAFKVFLLCFFSPTIYLYAPFAYTDTSGIFISALIVFLTLKIYESEGVKKYILSVAFAILASISFKLKVTIFIICIASMIYFILKAKKLKEVLIQFIVIAIAFFSMFALINYTNSSVVKITSEESEKYEFPMVHWVMMSMEYGGYKQEDVDFSESFDGIKAKKKADTKELKRRIKKLGVLGTLELVCIKKPVRTWGEITFSGAIYAKNKLVNEEGFLQEFVKDDGKYNKLMNFYAGIMYLLLLALVLIDAIKSVINGKDDRLCFMRLALLGFTALMMIWECNSRYVVVFLPCLFLLAGEGMKSEKIEIKKE